MLRRRGDTKSMIPKSCRLFGQDHAQTQEVQSAIQFNLNGSRSKDRTRRFFVLNRFDPNSPSAGEAEVKYLDGDFRVIRPGAFVRCAVTGSPIPLEELKYWSVERQEAYAGPDAVLRRLHPPRAPS
jgi:hypothetical protein